MEDIIAHKYLSYNGGDFLRDCKYFFNELYRSNQLLTSNQLDAFIKKIVFGKSRSLINISINIEVLNILTQRHLLTEKQVSSILDCFKWKQKSYVWIENLIKLGYNISDKQRIILIDHGYRQGIDLILNKDTATINDLNIICKMHELDNEKIKNFLDKFKIIPNLDTIEILCKNIEYNINTTNIIVAIDEMIKHNLPLSLAFIKILFNHIIFVEFSGSIKKYIERLFDENYVKCINDIEFIFIKLTPMNILNILYLIRLCSRFNIPHYNDAKYLKLLMTANHDNDKDKDNDKIFLKNYKDIVMVFLNSLSNESELLELLEHACHMSDEFTFDIILNKINKITDKCIIYACGSYNIRILKILLNMKVLPTIECLKALSDINSKNHEIFNILISNGLVINLETIEIAFMKNIYIDNLQIYGYQPDIEVYKICYKYQCFPNTYILQLKKNPLLHMDIRLAIHKDNEYRDKDISKSEDKIIQLIKDNNIIPDYMMYGHAVSTNKTKLIEYFEIVFNMKPNLDALILIDDLSRRQEYLRRIISCHNIPREIIMTSAVDYDMIYLKNRNTLDV